MFALAGFNLSIWSVFLVLVLVGPVLRWGRRSGDAWRCRRTRWGWEVDQRPHEDRERYEALAAELGERNAVIEQLESRVAELENRLDFAERMLTAYRPSTAELASPPSVPAGLGRWPT